MIFVTPRCYTGYSNKPLASLGDITPRCQKNRIEGARREIDLLKGPKPTPLSRFWRSKRRFEHATAADWSKLELNTPKKDLNRQNMPV